MTSDIAALVQKINIGINEDGSHLVDEDQLAFLGSGGSDWSIERRKQLDEFARAHGFDVHLSTWLRVAIFRNWTPRSGN